MVRLGAIDAGKISTGELRLLTIGK